MKRHMLIWGLLISLSTTPAFAVQMRGPKESKNQIPDGPKIKVLLAKDAGSAVMEVKGKYRVIRKDCGRVLSSGSVGKRFVVHALQDGLRWGEEYPDVYQISVVPEKPDTAIYINGHQYKGVVSVFHVRDNRISIVNEVPIESFLKATLAVQNAEDNLSQEALSALAIIARTEAYARVLSGKETSRPWDISAEEARYFGNGVTQQISTIDRAIDKTRFMVMESTKNKGSPQNVRLLPAKAEELAQQGLDAQKILRSAFPHTTLGVTIDPKEIAIR